MDPLNLLFLMSDEHNARMMGCSGHPVVQTPNLDALAARGARFANASCNSPICVPSRASFATGRYAHQIGAWDNAAPYIGQAPSWGHRLQSAGHRVTTVGKLHYRSAQDDIGFPDQRIPMNVTGGQGDLFGCIRTDIPQTRFQIEHVDEAGPGESEYIRYDTMIADQAIDWLHGEAPLHEQPWCLFVSFSLPHFPLIAPGPYFDLYPVGEVPLPIQWTPDEWPHHPFVSSFRLARVQSPNEFRGEPSVRRAIAAYLGMCTFLDAQIGRVLQALQNAGLASSTRIAYTSDHGETLGDYGLWGKSVMYDSALAVPLVLAGPDIPAGTVVEQNASLVDAFPTILENFGMAPHPEDSGLPGTSLWPAALGKPFPERTTFAEYHAMGSSSASYALRDRRIKYVHYIDYPPQLFDLLADPEERHDLFAEFQDRPSFRQDGHRHDPQQPCPEGKAVAPSPESPRVIAKRMETELRSLLDPEAIDAAAKTNQQDRLEANGGEATIRSAGPQINFTRAPPQFH